jgi:hypothetical protein
MKKLMIISFAVVLLMSAVAVAQYGAQQPDSVGPAPACLDHQQQP